MCYLFGLVEVKNFCFWRWKRLSHETWVTGMNPKFEQVGNSTFSFSPIKSTCVLSHWPSSAVPAFKALSANKSFNHWLCKWEEEERWCSTKGVHEWRRATSKQKAISDAQPYMHHANPRYGFMTVWTKQFHKRIAGNRRGIFWYATLNSLWLKGKELLIQCKVCTLLIYRNQLLSKE